MTQPFLLSQRLHMDHLDIEPRCCCHYKFRIQDKPVKREVMQLGHTHLSTNKYHVLMRLSIKTFDTVGFSVYWQSYVSQRARSKQSAHTNCVVLPTMAWCYDIMSSLLPSLHVA